MLNVEYQSSIYLIFSLKLYLLPEFKRELPNKNSIFIVRSLVNSSDLSDMHVKQNFCEVL